MPLLWVDATVPPSPILAVGARVDRARLEYQRYREAGDLMAAAGTAMFLATALEAIGEPREVRQWTDRARECEVLARRRRAQ
jgi:hypothetical protein